MTARIAQICRFPVKGLNAEPLESIQLTPGAGLPEDRRFVLAYGLTTGAKRGFFQLTSEEKLAQLTIAYDSEAPRLTIQRQGRQVVTADPTDQTGKILLNQFFAGFLAGSPRGTPAFQEAAGDARAEALPDPISIINLASIRDFERVARTTVDPERFRGNIMIDGLPAWDEFTWLGRELILGGARLKVTERTERCAATNVNPDTAERDMNIPLTLRKGFGHMDMGVYAEVTAGATIQVGDSVALTSRGRRSPALYLSFIEHLRQREAAGADQLSVAAVSGEAGSGDAASVDAPSPSAAACGSLALGLRGRPRRFAGAALRPPSWLPSWVASLGAPSFAAPASGSTAAPLPFSA